MLAIQLNTFEKQRTELQNKLENVHYSFTCKLQLYVSDIKAQSAKTAKDLTQIKELMAAFVGAQDNVQQMLTKRQEL